MQSHSRRGWTSRCAFATLFTLAALLPAAIASAAVNPSFTVGPDGANQPLGLEAQTDRVVVADFNGDAKLDVAAAFSSFDVAQPLAVALGDGTGHLGSFATVLSPTSPPMIAAADLNRDGRTDLVAGQTGASGVSVLLANGSGGFSAAAGSPLSTAGNSAAVATDDFNGDGVQDIAVLVAGSPAHVAVFLGDGAGHFSAAPGSPFDTGGNAAASPRFQERLVTADFDGDHKVDVALVNSATPNIVTMLGDGHGALGSATQVSALGPTGLATGDATGDALQDLAFTASSTYETGVGDGAGGFSSFDPYAGGGYTSGTAVALADLNGDGKLDTTVTSNDGTDPSGRVTILKGTGSTPWFTLVTAYNLLTGISQPSNNVAIGDLNGDGRPDLAVALNAGYVAILLNTTAIPSATTGPPSAVHDTNATVTGSVDPNGLSTTYAIELRNPGGATVTVAPAGPVTGSGPQPVSGSITGLSPSTAYQYRVTATNATGTTRGAWRGFTTTVSPPGNTAPPQVAGAAVTGQTLTCSPGSWTDSPAFSYQWTRGGVAVAGATGTSYGVSAADVGSALACQVTGANAGGARTATSPTLVATAALERPAVTRAPRVLGKPALGQALACDAGAWSTGGGFGYAWLRDGKPIAGATAVLYGIAVADGGHRLSCRVTVTNGAGSTSADSSQLRVALTRCTVPRVAKLTLTAAKRSLVAAGCRAGRVRRAHSRSVRSGRVVSSAPKAGSVKPLGTPVAFVVSSGR
jgi:hypothetical protein